MAYATPENRHRAFRQHLHGLGQPGAAFEFDHIGASAHHDGHLGLTPQSVNVFGGYKVQGRGDAAQTLFEDALAAHR
jgi:3-methyl-2-oxobutanoate hydroxymethyltransferase